MSSVNLDGDWISSIESNHPAVPSKNLRHIILALRQKGNRITATDSTGQVRIFGKVNGPTIEFQAAAHRPWGFNGIEGRWLIGKNRDFMEGRWSTINRPAGGSWNLRRFGNRGIELYTVDTGPERPFDIDDSEAFFDLVFDESKLRNVVFFIHGRGENFHKNFEPGELPDIERQSNTRFVILRWLSWGGATIRPIEHAVSAAEGLSRFLSAFDDYRTRHPDRVRHVGVTLMAHSMGNIPLMVLLQDFHEVGSLQPRLLDAVVLSSPDVPLQGHAEWVEKIDFTERIYIVQHRRDLVLRLSATFFHDRQEWQGRKLGIGPEEGEVSPGELAGNALYLDVTDLTLPMSHRHFDMANYAPSSRIYRLYQRLLNGQGIRFPDPEIGVFEPPGYDRRLQLSIDESQTEALSTGKESGSGR